MAIGPLYRPFAELVRELGGDVDGALAKLDLTFQQLLAADTRLTPDQGRALGRALLAAMPEDVDRAGIGLRAAQRFVTSDAQLLGYIMSHSATPLEAAHALAEHARLIGDSADFRVQSAADEVHVTLALLGGKQFLPDAADFTAAVVYRLLRELSRGEARPSQVQLPRPELAHRRMYERFFGAPVTLDAPAARLIYPRACMSVPFSQSDRHLLGILKAHARQRLQSLPGAGLLDRVRAFIAEGLISGDYALEHVAFRCGMSERTLRRKLSDAGTSYRDLMDDVRKERALHLLEADQSISLIAQHLGFSDATAFARAFRRWTGSAPHELAGRVR